MCVEIVLHQDDDLSVRVDLVGEMAKAFSVILLGPSFRHHHVTLPGQRFKHHEEVGHALANVLIVIMGRLSGTARLGGAGLADQLLAGFVQTHHRTSGVIGPLVHLQDVLHLPDKFGVGLGRNTPLLAQPRLEFVFLSVRRTV